MKSEEVQSLNIDLVRFRSYRRSKAFETFQSIFQNLYINLLEFSIRFMRV